MLQKSITCGQYGFPTSPAGKAKLNPNTGAYELPQGLQEWQENEEESEQGSMTSDAEWEGWRIELELKASDGKEPTFVTESDGLLRSRRRMGTLISGREKQFEGTVKQTAKSPVNPYLLLRGQPPGKVKSPLAPPSAAVVVDMMASSGAGPSPAALRLSPPSGSTLLSSRQYSSSVPNRVRSATIPASSDLPGALGDPPLPGLGGGFSSSYRPHTVTTISALRSAESESPRMGTMARVWSNKGKRRDKTEEEKTEDNPTSERTLVESPLLAVDYPNDAWTRSHNEGLDRLRHMSASGLHSPGSKGGLLRSLSPRDW